MSDLQGNGYNIWVDTREAANKPAIVNSLQKLHINVYTDNLGNAIDYLIQDINGRLHLIQRKTTSEMVNPKKAFQDLIEMGAADAEMYLLLEGSLGMISKWSKMPPQPIIGGIRSIVFDYKCRIIPTANSWWTSMMLAQIVKNLGKTKESRPLSVGENLDRELPLHEQGRKIIETLPNIGPKLAIRIMRQFGTARNALENLNQWSLIDGIASGKVAGVREVLDAHWVEKETVKSADEPINGNGASPSEPSES